MPLIFVREWMTFAILVMFTSVCLAKGEPVMTNPPIDATTRTAVIETLNSLLLEKYISLEEAQKITRFLSEKLKSGGYDSASDSNGFARVLTMDLFEVSNDRHFFLEYNPERIELLAKQTGQSETDRAVAAEFMRQQDRSINFGFRRVERLDGNIGYLDISMLCNPSTAGDTAVAAMNFLSNSDAVIIDLRSTPGGYPEMVQLICSYFVKPGEDGRTLLNTFERRFNNSIEQFWTLAHVPGKRMYDVDLYVLTSHGTASGAEELSYNLKNLERATLIGETTAGAAHPVETAVVTNGFVMNLPTGRPINPVTGTNWEQTGVEPHVQVPARDALDTACKMALEKRLKTATDELQSYQIKWAIDTLNARSNPYVPDSRTLKSYVGEYEMRSITLEKGRLVYHRKERMMTLIPIRADLFAFDDPRGGRVEFIRDDKGKVIELVVMLEDGWRDSTKRTK